MNTTVLSRHERALIIVGLDKYVADLKQQIQDEPNPAMIIANTKKIEEIGAIKERLRRY